MNRDLQAIADALPISFSYIDADQRYRFNNKVYEEEMGRSRDDVYGRHVAEVLGTPAYEVVRKDIETALSGEQASYEGLLSLDGVGDRHVRVIFVPDFGGGKVVKGLFTLVQDLTEQKQLETRARTLSAERFGITGDLPASVAQAINNPLTALVGTLEMSLESPTRAKPKPERILYLARRIKAAVTQMLQLFRKVHFSPAATDPVKLLEDVTEALKTRAEAQNVTLRLTNQPDLPRVVIDGNLLRTALVNIGENALDAMPDGGVLTLETDDAPKLGGIEFRISDSGLGIPPELREEVFQPFFTNKDGRAGLGLSIAREVIRGHEGRIRIDERPGGGTTLTIELPYTPARDADRSR
jgi:PAS domain S-box-containing protein